MGYDSNGNWSLLDGTLVNTGNKVLPSQHNPMANDFASGFSQVLVRDGRSGMTGTLSMGGFGITSMKDGTAATDAATVGQVGSIYGNQIGAATAKTTPVDADYLGIYDSAAANVLRKLTWANLKATLKTYFDTLHASVSRTISAGVGMTGGGDLSANRTISMGTPGSITNSSTNSATTGTHTHALGFTAAEVYAGSSASLTDYPIGTILLVRGLFLTRNAAATVYLSGSSAEFSGTGSTALTGTWRARGFVSAGSDQFQLMQRVS